MPLSNYALTLTDTAKAEVSIAAADSTQDALVQEKINAISRAMSRESGRLFHQTVGFVERVPGLGGPRLYVNRRPLISITEIALLDQAGSVVHTYDPTEYEIEQDRAAEEAGAQGIIYRQAGWPDTARRWAGFTGKVMAGTEHASIRVTYTGGWITPYQASASSPDVYPGGPLGTRTLPEDLEQACLDSFVSLWKRRGHNQAVQAESNEQVNVSYESKNGILLRSTIDVCRKYKTWS